LADSPPITAAEQAEIDARTLSVARHGRRPGLTVPENGAARTLLDSGRPILEGVRAAAELLDGERAEGYVAAVDAALEALREPERTPSAALVRALRDERATFAEYMRSLAEDHAAYFRDFLLPPEREAALAAIATQSMADARALVDQDSRPFAEYLREHLGSA
jgi:glutamate--cysteine ligase